MRAWCSWAVEAWSRRPPVPCWLRLRLHVWVFRPERLALRCARCQQLTRGWELSGPPPQPTPPVTLAGQFRWRLLKAQFE